MTSTEPTLTEQIFDQNVRINQIVHVPTMLAPEPFDEFEDLFGDRAFKAELTEVLGLGDHAHEWWEAYNDARYSDRGDLVQEAAAWAEGAPPWLVIASHPIEKRLSETSTSSSWGHYTSSAFTGFTFEQAIGKALDWAEAEHDVVLATPGEQE